MHQCPIVFAGAGLAAVRTAQALRDGGCTRAIIMLSDEPHPPYDRPPLSKGFLQGMCGEQDIRLLADAQISALNLDLRMSAGVAGLDRAAHAVLLADGAAVSYGTLVVATGARPIRLAPLLERRNTHVLRSLPDAIGLRGALEQARDVVVIGAGLVGLEVAAVALGRGARVSVIEAAPVPLAAVLGAELGSQVQSWHEAKGLAIRCGLTVTGADCDGVTLSDGRALAADLVLVGIGTVANVEWLARSGLDVQRGLVVDSVGRTKDPHIFGVGDAVSRLVGGTIQASRQWTLATEMARRVAKAILGQAEQPALIEDNYFWSDQHGARLQFAGSLAPEGELDFIAGGPGENTFLAAVRSGDSLRGLLGVGMKRDFLRHAMALRTG